MDRSLCFSLNGATKVQFKKGLGAFALCKEGKSKCYSMRIEPSTVWPGVETFASVWLQKKVFKPLCPALKCQLSRWISWPLRLKGVSGLSAAGGGSAVVRRSGVWLCKWRGRLHGGRGLLAAPFRLSHTAWGSLDIKCLVTMRETDTHFRQKVEKGQLKYSGNEVESGVHVLMQRCRGHMTSAGAVWLALNTGRVPPPPPAEMRTPLQWDTTMWLWFSHHGDI